MMFGLQRIERSFSIGARVPQHLLLAFAFSLGLGSASAMAQKSELDQAMSITAKQLVEYEKPGVAVLGKCKVAKSEDPTVYVVYHESGRILRRFVDTNGDRKLDVWSYFKDGVEVYRDVDSNFDGKADQYRWLGTAGTRWGLDSNQDGVIDEWKVISPEEVVYECYEAIRSLDQERFDRLMITPAEFSQLKLSTQIARDVEKRWQAAKKGFLSFAQSQKAISAKSKWIYAGNGQPAMIAADSEGTRTDVVVYNQGYGFFESPEVQQLAVGSLVKVGDVWRLIELPEIVDTSKPDSNGGAFFPMPEIPGVTSGPTVANQEASDRYLRLTTIEEQLATAKGAAREKLEIAKADVLKEFYLSSTDPKTKRDWLENLADSVSSSYQADNFSNGLEYLDRFVESQKDADGMDYVKWRSIYAKYGWITAHGVKEQRDNANDILAEELKKFQQAFPKSKFTPDALIQLAVHDEVRSPDEPQKAIQWYTICKARFPETKFGKRASGALVRLAGVGKPFPFTGKTPQGQTFDLSRYRGKIVVLHFWETPIFPQEDIEELARLNEKFKDDVLLVSCNIETIAPDESPETATKRFLDFLSKNKEIKWPQLHDPGSVERSELAHQLGIVAGPMVFLVDKKGNLVDSDVGIINLEKEIERERRR